MKNWELLACFERHNIRPADYFFFASLIRCGTINDTGFSERIRTRQYVDCLNEILRILASRTAA